MFLGTDVNDEIANYSSALMLYLEGQDPEKPIWLYINSPGGSVTAGMAIYDTMQFVAPAVGTICLGLGASMGQFLLCAGAPGRRYALPHARILLHQPYAGAQGQASDIEIIAKEIERMKHSLEAVLAHHTGQPVEKIATDTERDFVMTAVEAKEYGIIDEVKGLREELMSIVANFVRDLNRSLDAPRQHGGLADSYGRQPWAALT